jgi:hypothetical protein
MNTANQPAPDGASGSLNLQRFRPGSGAEVFCERALACYEAGDLAQAILNFAQYLELAPDAKNRGMVVTIIQQLAEKLRCHTDDLIA